MDTENKILFDWLTFTVLSADFTADYALEFLGLQGYPFQKIYGMHGYKDRYYLNGINVFFNGRDDMGVCIEMSGSGCRFFEEHGRGDIFGIIEYIFENPTICNIARLDIAYDDFCKLLDFDLICNVVYNYLRFVKPSETDSNMSRSDMTDYWETFLQSVEAVRLTKQGTEYNEDNLCNFVVKQTMSASSVFVDLFGLDLYLELMQLRSQSTLNQKYRNLLAKYGLEGGESFDQQRLGVAV